MNKPYDHFMKNVLLVSLGVLAISTLLMLSYMDSKDLTFQQIFSDRGMVLHFSGRRLMDDLDDITVNIDQSTSRFATKTYYQEDTFAALKNLQINSTIEEIRFIHEERDDVRVVYEREVPDTDSYDLRYNARNTSDKIIVDVKLHIIGLYTDQDYNGTITIYLPNDYEADSLLIHSNVASHNMSLPKKVDDVVIEVNLGSINLNVQQPLDSLVLSINAGDLYFETDKKVSNVHASVDTGELSFNIHSGVGTLKVENNVGEISGTLAASPTKMDVLCNLGDVTLDFSQPVKSLSTELNLGDLNINVDETDESIVYIDTDLVDLNSRLETTNQKSDANIFIHMNLGSASIK